METVAIYGEDGSRPPAVGRVGSTDLKGRARDSKDATVFEDRHLLGLAIFEGDHLCSKGITPRR